MVDSIKRKNGVVTSVEVGRRASGGQGGLEGDWMASLASEEGIGGILEYAATKILARFMALSHR